MLWRLRDQRAGTQNRLLSRGTRRRAGEPKLWRVRMEGEPPPEPRGRWLTLGGSVAMLLIVAFAYYAALWWLIGLLWDWLGRS